MIVEIKIPAAGESITEAAIGNWFAEDGSQVEKDQEIAEVETDKATLPLIATASGKLKIRTLAGVKVKIGDVACTIDTDVLSENNITPLHSAKDKAPSVPPSFTAGESPKPVPQSKIVKSQVKITPLAQVIMHQHNLDIDAILNGLRRITKQEVEQVINLQTTVLSPVAAQKLFSDRPVERKAMSPLRRKLGKRLVAVKNETAMLTTFNEVDMSALMEMRKKYQERFLEKHGQKLGLMSFFLKASAEALMLFPRVNSIIDGDDMIVPQFADIAVAVQTEKGLMVPVIRNAHAMNLVQLELSLAALAQKAKASKLSIAEMTGGTFTITNGGVFGSMLSTPILNPPQSAILGMHNIVDRPVAIHGKVEVRPVMYLALSYDHRLIDGRDSVTFLLKIKELIESPLKMVPGEGDILGQ